ncbi:response regulator [Chloroflexota bacterium]
MNSGEIVIMSRSQESPNLHALRGITGMAKRSRILIIDDTLESSTLLHAMLTLAGYEAETAGDWDQALSMISKGLPDLILLDTIVPKSDGYKVCSWLKGNETTSLIPVILI